MDKHDEHTGHTVRLDDPWYDVIASGWGETVDESPPRPAAGRPAQAVTAADCYREIQRSPAFQEVRRRYRGFALPATIAFLTWYFAYVIAATAAPGLMARPVLGTLNVAMLTGLGQFATTFLLTWAYVRHARLRRDRAAFDLRWETQELTRERVR